MFSNIARATCLSVILAAGAASAKTYECKIEEQGNQGWVPEVVVIHHDEETDKVTVNGPIIQHYVGKPVEGKAGVANAKRVSFSWSVDNLTAKGGGTSAFVSKFNYRIVIQKRSNRASVTAKPLGYRNSFRGDGTCSLTE